ncbi:MAG: hypothetical protein ACE5FU_05355 [Nitrospinota bacterium]
MTGFVKRFLVLLAVTTFFSGCFGHRHKEYTFDQKFEYHSGKVMKNIRKVVSDETKIERIENKIRSHKSELQNFFLSFKKGKKELLDLILEGKSKEDVQRKLRETGDRKLKALSGMVKILFDVRGELTDEQWSKISENFKHDCAHWWK